MFSLGISPFSPQPILWRAEFSDRTAGGEVFGEVPLFFPHDCGLALVWQLNLR